MIWVLVGYIFLYVYRPFEYFEVLATIRLERLYMIVTLFAWLATFSTKTWTYNRNCAALFFVAGAIFISALFSPFAPIWENMAVQDWFKIYVFFLLMITCVKTEKELKLLVGTLLFSVMFYMLHSLYEHLVMNRGKSTMGIWRLYGIGSSFAGPNRLCQLLSVSMVMLLPFVMMVRSWKSFVSRLGGYLFVLTYILFVLTIIQRTGSRSGLLLLIIYLFGFILLSKRRFTWITICILCAPIFWMILPESMQDRFLSIIDESRGGLGAQASKWGRLQGLLGGLGLWYEYPVFGIAPGNYRAATGSAIVTHSLIGQLLGEFGTVGTLAYLTLVLCIIVNYWEAFKLYKQLKRWGREKEGAFLYYIAFAVLWGLVQLFFAGFAADNALLYFWVWYAAFQAIAVVLLRKKVAAIQLDIFQKEALRQAQSHSRRISA